MITCTRHIYRSDKYESYMYHYSTYTLYICNDVFITFSFNKTMILSIFLHDIICWNNIHQITQSIYQPLNQSLWFEKEFEYLHNVILSIFALRWIALISRSLEMIQVCSWCSMWIACERHRHWALVQTYSWPDN